jgi:hypothetical protein
MMKLSRPAIWLAVWVMAVSLLPLSAAAGGPEKRVPGDDPGPQIGDPDDPYGGGFRILVIGRMQPLPGIGTLSMPIIVFFRVTNNDPQANPSQPIHD